MKPTSKTYSLALTTSVEVRPSSVTVRSHYMDGDLKDTVPLNPTSLRKLLEVLRIEGLLTEKDGTPE